MVKALFSFSITCFLAITGIAQTIGSSLPALQFTNLQNGEPVQLGDLKNKVVLIDCWATWCTPCITGMKDMNDWQKQFGNKLVVLAISEEKPERLKQFLKYRPSQLTVISDTAGEFRKVFPYRSIPHTILVGTDGKVKAITSASNLSAAVIKKVINNESIDLPLKQDNMKFDMENYLSTGLKPDTTQEQQFTVQPGIEGAGSMSKTYPNTPYVKRRLSVINGTMQLLVQLAYQRSYYRVIDEYNAGKQYKEQEKFCIDVWVKEKNEAKLFDFFQSALSKQFIDMEIVKEKRKMKVTVLYAHADAAAKLQPCSEALTNSSMNSLSYGVNCSSIGELINYLESFGMCGTIVLDETGLTGRYKLGFELEPGKDNALKEALEKFGLYLKKEEREVEMLVIKRR